MYPNPQDVLPLPPRPSLEQYRKRAKELVKACKATDAGAVRAWVVQWFEALAALRGGLGKPSTSDVDELEQFARRKMSRGPHATCALADAQFVIARVHGFTSWPAFVAHLESLERATSPISTFEAAADAIVNGDAGTLERLLREQPALIRTRSTREHRATLLHYVAANGVENYRQRTPKNAAAVTEVLLKAGAEVDAAADVYGGGCTTLGLVATSVHPFNAGVQRELIDVLLKHGARLDGNSVGNKHNLITGCLANGRPEAAEYLATRGAPLSLVGAAGVGRLDVVKTYFDESGGATMRATSAEMKEAFAMACVYGRAHVVDFLLDQGIEADAWLTAHGEGHTGLHVAAFHAHVDTIKALVRRGASMNLTDKTWGTPPLVWAMYAWGQEPTAPRERYYEAVATLVAAGAIVKPAWLQDESVRADPRMVAALTASREG